MSFKLCHNITKDKEDFLQHLYKLGFDKCLNFPPASTFKNDQNNGTLFFIMVWRLLTEGTAPKDLFMKTHAKSLWRILSRILDFIAIGNFFLIDMCNNDYGITNKIVNGFISHATFMNPASPPLVGMDATIKRFGSTNIFRTEQAYASFQYFSDNGKGKRMNVMGEYLALFCAFCYYIVHTTSNTNPMPTWMTDILIINIGAERVLTSWNSWFPNTPIPKFDVYINTIAPEIPSKDIYFIIDIMSKVVMPLTYLTYATAKKWERHKIEYFFFPSLQDDNPIAVAALYAYCSYVAKKHGVSKESLFSFVRYYIHGQTQTSIRRIQYTPAHVELAKEIVQPILHHKKPEILRWLTALFINIGFVTRYHCIRNDLSKNSKIWRYAIDAVQVNQISTEVALSALQKYGMESELRTMERVSDNWWFFKFDLSDAKEQTTSLFNNAANRDTKQRMTDVTLLRGCLDVNVALWWNLQRMTVGRSVQEFNIARLTNQVGIISMVGSTWMHDVRGIQWAISVNNGTLVKYRCPAHMAIMSMLISNEPVSMNRALICINSLISGFLPFHEFSGVQFIPSQANDIGLTISLLTQILARCVFKQAVYSGLPELIRNCMCGDDTILRAILSLIRLKEPDRQMTRNAATELKSYLTSEGNIERINTTLVKNNRPEKYNFERLVEFLVMDDNEQALAHDPVDISEYWSSIRLICANMEYITDHVIAIKIFSGIFSPSISNVPKPAVRSKRLWNAMVQLTDTNLFYNYFAKMDDYPICNAALPGCASPVAICVHGQTNYNARKYARFGDMKVLSAFVYFMELDGYLEYPIDNILVMPKHRTKRKRKVAETNEEDEDEYTAEVIAANLNGEENGEENGMSDVVSADGRRWCNSSVTTLSDISKVEDMFEINLPKDTKLIQATKKEQLGTGIPLFPFRDTDTYTTFPYSFPMAIDRKGNVVYDQSGLLLPRIPLGLSPEETTDVIKECSVGPLGGVKKGFLYAILCIQLGKEVTKTIV